MKNAAMFTQRRERERKSGGRKGLIPTGSVLLPNRQKSKKEREKKEVQIYFFLFLTTQ